MFIIRNIILLSCPYSARPTPSGLVRWQYCPQKWSRSRIKSPWKQGPEDPGVDLPVPQLWWTRATCRASYANFARNILRQPGKTTRLAARSRDTLWRSELIPCNEMRRCETTGTRRICRDMRQIHAGSANRTQMLRAPAARGARNKGCYFWTPLSEWFT
jgi:hypothetical protein